MRKLIPACFAVLTIMQLLLTSRSANGYSEASNPSTACSAFAGGQFAPSVWTLEDCENVWAHFEESVPAAFRPRLPDIDMWGDTGRQLRHLGSPCMVKATFDPDGVGSTTIRNLATWIFSEEMACDWLTPSWSGSIVTQGNGTTSLYCHWTATLEEADLARKDLASRGKALRATNRCSVVDWLSYFHFDAVSVRWPETATLSIVEPTGRSFKEGILGVQGELKAAGGLLPPWDHVVFDVPNSWTSQYLITLGSWDSARLETTRKVLREARANFHRHPRPWYDESLQCGYDDGRLHFAIHIRMGDRRALYDGSVEYFRRVERIVDQISEGVSNKGMRPPLFHVFSETVAPCPSADTGLFDEFPSWPLDLDQIASCLVAEIPADCPEKVTGAICPRNHSGIFRVLEKPILLHVHPHVPSAMSCMIQADGVLMGCSTFGQIAGLLTKGISLFSTQCGGARTPVQYKLIPPLAVAEMGYLWVPVDGSWRDPVLQSPALLAGALDILVAKQGNKARAFLRD